MEVEIHKPDLVVNGVIKRRRTGCVRCVACLGEMRNAHRIFVGKHEGKRSLGSLRYRWEANIRINLKEMWQEDAEWMCLA
jgi:hypothetical protein